MENTNKDVQVGNHFNINQVAHFVGINPVAECIRRSAQAGRISDKKSRFYQFCVAHLKDKNNKVSKEDWPDREANLIERCRLIQPILDAEDENMI